MIRIYLYVSAGLLIVATIISALLDNWDILVGIGLGLACVLAIDLLGNWLSDRIDGATERHREALVGKRPIQTTYYYDDEDDTGTSPASEETAAQATKRDQDEQTR